MNTLKTNWCSIDFILQVASTKWNIPIIMALSEGSRRPTELSRTLSGINPKILTERLRSLEKWGLVNREEYREIPPRVEYSLTTRSWELLNAIKPMRDLGENWQKREPSFFSHHLKEECIYCSSNSGNGEVDAPSYDGHSSTSVDNYIDFLKNQSDGQSTKLATVYLVGAGPGANDLISVRGAKILRDAAMVLYSAALEPEAVLDHCTTGARLLNTDGLSLDEQKEYYLYAKEQGIKLARLYSGDPTLFGYIAEQIESLEELDIEYEIIPGVSVFTASAATVGSSLTRLRVAESVIITNVAKTANQKARPEDLKKIENLAVHKTTMCIYIRGPYFAETIATLSKHYPPQTPINLICRPQQSGQQVHRSNLATILDEINIKDWQATTMMLVGNTLAKVSAKS